MSLENSTQLALKLHTELVNLLPTLAELHEGHEAVMSEEQEQSSFQLMGTVAYVAQVLEELAGTTTDRSPEFLGYLQQCNTEAQNLLDEIDITINVDNPKHPDYEAAQAFYDTHKVAPL
jgi:hypothetical protein